MVCCGGVARGTAPCGEGWREWLWVPCCFITESNQKSISGNQLKALSCFIVFSSLYLILNVVRIAKSGWNYSKTTPAISQTDWLKCFGGSSRRNPLKYHRKWRRIPTLSRPQRARRREISIVRMLLVGPAAGDCFFRSIYRHDCDKYRDAL